MVSVVKLVNRDFAFFCLDILLNTVKFEWPKNSEGVTLQILQQNGYPRPF